MSRFCSGSPCCSAFQITTIGAILSFVIGTILGYQSGEELPEPVSTGQTWNSTFDRPQEKDDKPEDPQSDLDVEKNVASYEQVWKTIKKLHWDEELVGESWDQAKEKYLPAVRDAKSMRDVRKAMESLIAELGQSHFGVIPADSYDDVETESGGDGYAGLEFRLADQSTALVTRVVKDSPADQAGVKPGWKLLEFGDRKIADQLSKLEQLKSNVMRTDTLAGLALTRRTTAGVGKTKRFLFEDLSGEQQEVKLEMIEQPGNLTRFGNFPEMRVSFESSTLDDGIGYFRFNMFFDPARVMKAYNNCVQDPAHANGMIIDLRGNVGGLGAMTMGMARPFAKEQTKLGTMMTRSSNLKFAVFPALEPYEGKVAVLVDACSISSAEILSGGLQDIGAAKVFGQRTAGLALPSNVTKLPNGDGFQYAFANYISEKGKSLEKAGVTPDFPIELSTSAFKDNPDPVLNAAIDWIEPK